MSIYWKDMLYSVDCWYIMENIISMVDGGIL